MDNQTEDNVLKLQKLLTLCSQMYLEKQLSYSSFKQDMTSGVDFMETIWDECLEHFKNKDGANDNPH